MEPPLLRSLPGVSRLPESSAVCAHPGPCGSRGVHLCGAPRQNRGTWFRFQPAMRLRSCPFPSPMPPFPSCATNCGARTVVSSTCPGEPQGSVAGSGRWAGVRARHPRSSPMLSSARVSVSETGLVTEDPWVPRAPRGPGVANSFTDPSCRAAVSPRGLICPGGPRGKAGPAPHRQVSGPLWGRSGSFGAVRDRGWPRHVGHATGQGWGNQARETVLSRSPAHHGRSSPWASCRSQTGTTAARA